MITLEAITKEHLHFVKTYGGATGLASRVAFGVMDTIPEASRPPANTVSSVWNGQTYTITCTLDDDSQVSITYDPADIPLEAAESLFAAPVGPGAVDTLTRNVGVIPASGTTDAIAAAYFKTGELVFNSTTGRLLIASTDGLGSAQTWTEFAKVV